MCGVHADASTPVCARLLDVAATSIHGVQGRSIAGFRASNVVCQGLITVMVVSVSLSAVDCVTTMLQGFVAEPESPCRILVDTPTNT